MIIPRLQGCNAYYIRQSLQNMKDSAGQPEKLKKHWYKMMMGRVMMRTLTYDVIMTIIRKDHSSMRTLTYDVTVAVIRVKTLMYDVTTAFIRTRTRTYDVIMTIIRKEHSPVCKSSEVWCHWAHHQDRNSKALCDVTVAFVKTRTLAYDVTAVVIRKDHGPVS